jgi:hypothetical protein
MDNTPPLLDLNALLPLAERLAPTYATASPFPHIVIDDLLPPDLAERLLAEFPPVDSEVFKERTIGNVQKGKYGSVQAKRFVHAPPFLQNMLLWLNSYAILHFLETLTGIHNLLVDPYFHGGGLHQSVQGGHLDIHADFNFEPNLKLYRRLNLLYYLNKEWKEEFGGQLELWDPDLSRCEARIAPIFNRCVIFTTSSTSFHGHPRPLQLPPGHTRKSIAAYYYTAEPGETFDGIHQTLWKKPGKGPPA